MSILNKFTKQNLKLNKKRSIVTIIGIMLSTALVCAVAGMVTSTQKTLVNLMIVNEGNYHVCFNDVPSDEVKYIEQNEGVESFFETRTLGYSYLKNSYNDDKPYVYVMEYSKKALENSGLQLTDGRMPENSNEIVISQHIIDNARVNLKIGDTVTFDIGQRELMDGTILTQKNSFNEDTTKANGAETIKNEQIVNSNQKTYTVVGIMERPCYLMENFDAPGYTVISYLEDNTKSDNINVSVLFKNAKDNEEITDQILSTIKADTGVVISITTNTDLLRFGGALGDASLRVLYGIAGVVIVIIVVSSVFVIRNSFSISVSEKTKQYGMLTSVGATKKQIRKTVLLEGLFIGIIAIPLGIICGIIAIVILLWIVNLLLGDMLEGANFIYSVPILPILISVVISAVTIYLSCIIPARRAAKISPIEAIRGNDDIKIKSKKIKTSKLTKKIFGIGGVIASKNLKRSKKKYRTTVISLVVSISIFVALSSFLTYGKKMTNMYYTDLKFNININGESEEIYKQISKMENINDYSYSYATSAGLDMDRYGTDFLKKCALEAEADYKEYAKDVEGVKDEYKYRNYITVVMLNNQYFEKFAKELGISNIDLKDVAILEDDMIEYHTDGSKTVQNFYNVKETDTITLSINDQDKEVKITKRTDERPMGYESTYSTGGYIFVSEDFIENKLDKDYIYLSSLNIDSSNPSKLESELVDLKKENANYADISVTNLSTYADQAKRLILLVSIFLYGFIAVITLIGVTNIFNTITTNMILRSKEFANLKSIGMTSKEFNKMIILESTLYGLKSLLIGIPIGLVGSYCIYRSFASSVDFGYLIPWESIAISIVFVFLIVGLTMRYSLKKINKQNIIETIRQDNI